MSKEYTIENEYLKLTVTSWGDQVKSVVRKCDNVEHMWQANPDVWTPCFLLLEKDIKRSSFLFAIIQVSFLVPVLKK